MHCEFSLSMRYSLPGEVKGTGRVDSWAMKRCWRRGYRIRWHSGRRGHARHVASCIGLPSAPSLGAQATPRPVWPSSRITGEPSSERRAPRSRSKRPCRPTPTSISPAAICGGALDASRSGRSGTTIFWLAVPAGLYSCDVGSLKDEKGTRYGLAPKAMAAPATVGGERSSILPLGRVLGRQRRRVDP